jgi:hypothetical protein
MRLANITKRSPHLVQALEAFLQRGDCQAEAQILIHELSGITVLVARKFTNDRTADGLLEAFYLTVGCVSLGISQADVPENNESKLSFLLHHGAEYVFQMGFRLIKELSSLPYDSFVSDFDNDPFIQQRNIKMLFSEICRADPLSTWSGDEVYKNETLDRKRNQKVVECAKWLRNKHFAGSVKDPDLDANAVIAIAVIFAILGDGRIVARTGQKEIENLIHRTREIRPDVEAGWSKFLKNIPLEYHPILRERMDEYKSTIVRKILSKTRIKAVITEMQDYYAGNELDIDYP